MEIRHSAILSWLLDPRETHSLGERFLKALLSEALRGQDWRDKPTALDIVQADLSDVEIRREWQHIDIFVFSPRNQWAAVCRSGDCAFGAYSQQRLGELRHRNSRIFFGAPEVPGWQTLNHSKANRYETLYETSAM